jgi:hypothetical protein
MRDYYLREVLEGYSDGDIWAIESIGGSSTRNRDWQGHTLVVCFRL